jgi:hypothetical protein
MIAVNRGIVSLPTLFAPCSLLIIFDNIGRAQLGIIGIFADVTQRAALPKQIPALVQLDFHLMQTVLVVAAQITLRVESFLLCYKFLDVLEHCTVFHR